MRLCLYIILIKIYIINNNVFSLKPINIDLISSSGGGGSFAPETIKNAGKQQNGVNLHHLPFQKEEIIETHPLVRAPKFNVCKHLNNKNIKILIKKFFRLFQ